MKKNFWEKTPKPILALAPMAGITDSSFRQICKKFGAQILYSEMASASALFFNPLKTLKLIKFKEKERPYIVQLFGNNPEHFKKATKIISQTIKPDGIDINFGCPVKKVFNIGAGVALMLDFKKSREVIKAVTNNTDLPVSIKIRSGIKNISAVDFIKKISDLNIAAIMIHGRSYEQGFIGKIDFSTIKKIKKIFPKIVLGNGGINTPQDAKNLIEKTNVDGIGIARGAQGKPWLFEQIKNYFQKGEFQEKTPKQIFKIILQHAKLSEREKGKTGIIEMRKHLCWYVRNMPGAKTLRQKLIQVNTLQDIEKILQNKTA